MHPKPRVSALALPAARALRKLGHDIRDARRRRRISLAIAAERASIGRMTLIRIEKGDPSVSIGHYAAMLFVLGLVEKIADLADPGRDALGLQLEEERLPKRIRRSRPKPTGDQ